MEWPRIGSRTKKTIAHAAFFVVALFLIIANVNLFQAPVVDFEVQTSQPGMFQIFWSGFLKSYSEKNSVFQKDITPFETHRFSIQLRHPRGLVFGPNIHYLRIDPLDRPGEILIKNIHLRQGSLFSIDIAKVDDFKKIKKIDGIKTLKIQKSGLKVVTDNNDPKLEIKVVAKPRYATIIPFVLGCLLLLYSLKYLSGRFRNMEYVDWLFFFVLALIVVMAVLTGPGMHPDEVVHGAAAEYYSSFTHWLPPAADDPEIIHTYSLHGVSRLNSKEIAYVFAGKFLEFFSFIPVEQYLILRFFNIALFCILAIFCLGNPKLRILSLPIFISPQIWYIFSYFNSDAFALFILFVITYQVMNADSSFNRYLYSEQNAGSILSRAIGFGLLFSFLFLIKKNFYFFPVFLFFYFLLQFYKKRYPDPKLILKRLGVIGAVAVCLFSVHYTLHAAVNDWHRTENIVNMQNKTADAKYNPLINPDSNNKYLNLKGKGVPLSYLWKDMQWGHITFMSTFGVFGNMSIYNSLEFYDSVSLLLYLILICILYDLLRQRASDGTFLLFMAMVACSIALVAASLYNSWIADYQAQGRYLLPIVPMIAIFLYSSRQRLHWGRINFFVLLLFLFSSTSFIFLGLARIPKL